MNDPVGQAKDCTVLKIEWAGHRIELHSDRAAYLPEAGTLVVADIHLGKPAAFRSAGVPVPEGTTEADLRRLGALLECTGARRLVILGDLLHARAGREPETLNRVTQWRGERAGLEIVLVRGNHDRRAGDPPEAWQVTTLDAYAPLPGLLCRHEPEEAEGVAVLAGHLHPAVTIRGKGCDAGLRAPCFWLSPRVATLPAFGSFTGSASVRPRRGDRVFALGDGEVIEVSAAWR